MNEEHSIISKALKGNEAAYKTLYDRYHKALFLICIRYENIRENAEDMLQEAFIRIFKQLQTYDISKGSFYTWASRITVNVILENKRKKKIAVLNEDLSDLKLEMQEKATVFEKLEVQDIVAALHDMPDGYRTVFNLFCFEGYTHQEVAEYLGVSVSTSKTQLMKARQFIQDSLNTEILVTKAG
jgi:RNA polymerase sigma factor (sigma-70 family)